MPYREKRIYSGDFFESEIYPISEKENRKSRKQKLKESRREQKNLNDKNAKKKLIRLINANFSNLDIVVHLTYQIKYLPRNSEEARRDVTNYLRRINHYRKKEDLPPLKYIAVIEYREPEEGKRGIRIHHHIVMSGMDRDIAEKLWGKGRANADRLQADEFGYEGLARYITKDPQGNKRWTQSKNLQQPVIKINDSKFTKRKVMELSRCPEDKNQFERLYPGYIFNECQVQVNEINSGTYIYIKMRKLRR